MNEAHKKVRRTGGFVIKTCNRKKKILKEWGTRKTMTTNKYVESNPLPRFTVFFTAMFGGLSWVAANRNIV